MLIAAPKPSRILKPGLSRPSLPPERHLTPNGGALLLDVSAGDGIVVRAAEGGARCEVFVAGAEGRADLGVLGESGPGEPLEALALAVGGGDPSARRLERALTLRGIDARSPLGLRLFGESAPRGDAESFTVQREGYLLAAAVGEGIEIEVRRANPRWKAGIAPPEPLADPLLDLRVASATAEAYVVKKGEYIQILDVAGRQMTDFQCFSARLLDKGQERPLDATITRTLLGRAYPTPGLPSKAFSLDFEPLVEVVQDTCGRHDAFATACTSRYYDDMGYPGHVNCTDNFNAALNPYGVTPRRGWEALNFFYNTRIDDQNRIVFDEPWSRPGDYVLLRALTDLVCVSSACPDDIDPGNAWQPSDIHVRTYAATERFSRAIAFRPTPDAEPVLTKETGFHAKFAQFTRQFEEYRGYWLAQQFDNGGAIDEYWACREKAVVMDLSPLRKFDVTGPDAEALLNHALTRNVRKLGIGQVVYSAMCYEHGGMLDDGTLYRLGHDNFRWVCGDEYCGEWLKDLAGALKLHAFVKPATDQLHNIAVQGPKSRAILDAAFWTAPAHTPIATLAWFHHTPARIGGFDGAPVLISRTGYTGELGFEIYCHPRHAPEVFDAVWAAGEKYGLKPFGLAALDMTRIEAGLIFAGYEFDDQTDPFEAGIGFTVALKGKDENFIGRAALERRRANPMKKLVGLEIDAREPAVHGDCVHVGRAQVGVVTSGLRSPVLDKTIALARVDVACAAEGTELEIGKLDGRQKRLPAKVVPFPHYDPTKSRVKV